jgi:hypothetical protein
MACLWLVASGLTGSALAQLQVQSARWQVINGNAGCDALRQVADACNGRSFCQIYVDPRYLCGGDPAPGRLKSLNVGYSCYGRQQPTLAFPDGSQALLRCDNNSSGGIPGGTPGGSSNGGNPGGNVSHNPRAKLQVFSARWDAIDGSGGCDATAQLTRACDGKSHCSIFVDPRYLCHGDPTPGEKKRLDIRYACDGERRPAAVFEDFQEARLHCAREWPGGVSTGNPPPVVNPPPVINPPPGNYARNLHINSARWEAVDGAGWCDALPQMSASCNGKAFCQVYVDPRYLCNGDPAPGHNKSLRVSYQCNGKQQTPIAWPDFAQALLRCDGQPTPPAPPPVANRSGILKITTARWEQIGGGGWCDPTAQLARACDGKRFCKVPVDPQHLCNGDPAPGNLKSLDIYYTCDGRPNGPISFPDFANATIGCGE